MSNPFHIGQRVVYIGHKSHGKFEGYQYPEVGKVYTVRKFGDVRPELIMLMEIDNSRPEDIWEAGYHHSGFRPVFERKTDISIFKAMLKTHRTRISA